VKLVPTSLFAATALLFASFSPAQAQITPPEKFFGFQLGADRKMARWDKIVEYFQLMEKESGGRMKVINMGPTSMGNPFLMLVISSPGNLAKLDRLKQINAQLSDPRGIAEAEIKKLVAEGRPIVVQSMSMHATEIGGAQMAPELVYDELSRKDEEAQRMLENVISIVVPCFNPDGEIMVTDWYRKYVDTEFEGSNPPGLYQKYVGHDNNRDAFQTNMIESRYMAKILFTEWKPEAYVDHHGMGPYGARIFLPPYAEPVRPKADPLIWRELSWYGAHMAYKEEENGLNGVFNMGEYSGWGHFGFHWITPFHNITGMLTESAAAQLATPLFLHPEQLQGGARNLPKYEEETIFPNPWPGGWWHLRDIVERQKVSAWATLDLAARNKDTVLWNAYLKGKRQTERGAAGSPKVFIIPAAQHDPLTADLMINKLLIQGIEIKQATKPFSLASGMTYAPGTFVVSMAQPKMGLIRYLLGRTFFPDNDWTHNKDGSPIRPYDMSTDTMYEYMGVRVDPVDEAIQTDLKLVTAPITPVGTISKGPAGYVISGSLNQSFNVVNQLLAKGIAVQRIDKPTPGLNAGDFVIPNAPQELVASLSKETGVDFMSLKAPVTQGTHEVTKLRIGMYERYSGGNIDQGWTQWVLEQFKFPVTSIFDAELKKGDLNAKYDVIIFPEDTTAMITGEAAAGGAATAGGRGGGGGRGAGGTTPAPAGPPAGPPAGGGGGFGGGIPAPPEYRTGIGAEGVASLRAFVQKGGTLVTLGGASNFAIERFGLSIRNVTTGKSTKEFWCPGSTLKIKVDNNNPLAYGMPPDALAVYLMGNPAFALTPTAHNERYEVVARYADRDLLQSGWLVGEDTLARTGAVVSAHMGTGKILLIGFRTQHRGQTHGTFKLLFNSLIG
jgi:Zinc carboxypeptidase